MKKFINLLSDELKRARLFYAIILGLVVVSQLVITAVKIYQFNHEPLRPFAVSLANFIDGSGAFPLFVSTAIGLLAFFSIYTWTREWLGSSLFIHRLLTLPGNRFVIVLAKWASLMLMIGGFFFTHLLMSWLIHFLATSFMNSGTYSTIPWNYSYAQNLTASQVFLPMTIDGTVILYASLSWGILAIFAFVVTFLLKQDGAKFKALLSALMVVIGNILLLVGAVQVQVLLYTTKLEGLIVWLVTFAVAIAMNLIILNKQLSNLSVKPAKEVKI